jgi:hypothetical protein
MIKEHYKAVAALIRPTIKVYIWEVPSTPSFPYVLLWGSLGDEVADTLNDLPRSFEARMRATYVGVNGDSVAGIAAKVRQDVTRKRPEVEGWSVQPLQMSSLADIQKDESMNLPGEGHALRAVDEIFLQSDRIV